MCTVFRVSELYRAPATCRRCRVDLVPVFGATTPYWQCENALVVQLCGGYAMFVDDFDRGEGVEGLDERFDVLLCHDCAHQLVLFLGVNVTGWHQEPTGSGRGSSPWE